MLNSGIGNAGVKKVIRICDYLGIDTDALADGSIKEKVTFDNSISFNEEILLKKYRALDEHGKDITDYVLNAEYDRCVKEPDKQYLSIPYYGKLASAGTGMYIFDDIPFETIEVEKDVFTELADFAIGVNGDSMEPDYHDGDIVLIQKMNDIPNGVVGLFIHNGQSYIKLRRNQMYSKNTERFQLTELVSLNKKYEPIICNNETRCIGKVIDKL